MIFFSHHNLGNRPGLSHYICTAIIAVVIFSCPSAKAQNPATGQPSGYILTPKPGPEPRLTVRKVFGVRPNHPLLLTVTATGTRPLVFSADKLPKGVSLDAGTGQLTGTLSRPGEYMITLHAKNKLGKDERKLKIIVGEAISLTPPMGWNSWNIYAEKVTQQLVVDNAKAMVTSGLADHGWSYINIDDTWQDKRGGKFNAIQPDPVTFPDMAKASDEIHALGLKIGIYSTPWAESYARHIGGTSDDPAGKFEPSKEKVPHNIKKMPYAIGKYDFTDNDVKQWAGWKMDYLKYDWNPNEVPETKKMYDALRNSGRDIIFSLSNSTPFASVSKLYTISNSWRTGGDITDSWGSLKGRMFAQDKWEPYAGPGHWNDPDMMVVGVVGLGRNYHPSKLTPDEQYAHMSAWCLMSVPLLLGCDLTKLDEFTISLLTNDEVIAVNQDPLGKQATIRSKQGDIITMAKDMEDGSKAAGLFNVSDTGAKPATLSWADLGISGKYIVRDLWRQKDLGVFEGEFKTEVNQHGVVMISLRKK